MFCPSCGIALTHQMKYCNRCGAQLASGEGADLIKATEKRLSEYLDGLFWITVFGLAAIVGGMALIKKLQLGEVLMVAFLIVSSAAFLINFWLSLREVQRLKLELKQVSLFEPLNTKELAPPSARSAFDAVSSVTEHTTRDLKAVAKEKIPL
ncbi:MAG: zinc ribbon domain-containing protein [Pyrinomonadaceae bacterium]